MRASKPPVPISPTSWTETSVANKETFSKHGDVWANYLGPERPASAAVEKPQWAGADFLVEIRAVAVLK
jgi:enamine deaminase RidA (YjgF/YER057c/UK114 family)